MPKHRILLVDDEEHVARTLKLGLVATGGYDVEIENRGCRAIDTARTFGPDLVILDVVMPEKRGEDVLREFRQASDLHHIPVFFLTAAIPEPQSDRPQPDRWITKPVLVSEIVREIERRLGKRSTE
jgi:DNA-binding response OmpR family regulator